MKPHQTKLLTGLLEEFPKAATKTIARIAYKRAPSLFRDIEAARGHLRTLRGANGERKRSQVNDKRFFRKPRKSGDPFSKISRGRTHFQDWGAVQIDGPMRALLLADLHIPYHDRGAIIAALRYGKSRRADTVLLNGDIADCFSVSFWEKDPRKRDFVDEVEQVRNFLSLVRSGYPKARIIYKIGNHEERFERYMSVKAPELLGLPEFSFKSVFQLDQFGVDLVEDKRPIRLGKLNVVHGHEYKFAIANPVNPARGYFLRAKAHCIGSHLHQSSQHSEKNIEQRVISTWSTGCLCDLHPDYTPLNPWNLGFAFIEVDREGAFNVANLKVIDGKVY